MSKQKFKYDLRKVDALQEEEGLWYWNSSLHYSEFSTAADNKRAFLYALHKEGIYCKRGKCRAYFDGEIFVLEDRKTKEPLFAAIPLY